MSGFIKRRLMLALPVIFGVVTLVFMIIHLVPGDPVEMMLGENAAPADKETLRKELGLDKPLTEQYLSYMSHLLRGDLGQSHYTKTPVIDAITAHYPATIELALASIFIAIIIAIPIGAIAAIRQDSAWDNLTMAGALLGVSIPNFWLGPMLAIIFSIWLGWLPVSGRGGVEHLVLPAITLGMSLSAILTRMTRSAMIEVIREEYITTARAKGLGSWGVYARHALRNALLPVVTILGMQFGALLAGAVITETIFAWPGVGRLFINAIFARDFPLVQGCVLVISLTYLAVNLAVDVVYSVIDPRIRIK